MGEEMMINAVNNSDYTLMNMFARYYRDQRPAFAETMLTDAMNHAMATYAYNSLGYLFSLEPEMDRVRLIGFLEDALIKGDRFERFKVRGLERSFKCVVE